MEIKVYSPFITATDLSSILNNVKMLLGIEDIEKDDLLVLMINQAVMGACNYCHRTEIDCLSGTIVDMVVYKYQKRGSEALGSESFGGVSLGYLDDYPETILKELRAKRKALLI